MLGEMGYSCKLHLPWSQTGYLGGGQQFSRWILKAGNHFAKIFLSFCSLKRKKNKEKEMQDWGWGQRGQRLVPPDFYFECKMSFCNCIAGREGDTSSSPTQTEMAYFCVGETQVDSARELLWARGELKLSASSCTASSPLSPSPFQWKEKPST